MCLSSPGKTEAQGGEALSSEVELEFELRSVQLKIPGMKGLGAGVSGMMTCEGATVSWTGRGDSSKGHQKGM